MLICVIWGFSVFRVFRVVTDLLFFFSPSYFFAALVFFFQPFLFFFQPLGPEALIFFSIFIFFSTCRESAVEGLGFQVHGSWFRILWSGFRVLGLKD